MGVGDADGSGDGDGDGSGLIPRFVCTYEKNGTEMRSTLWRERQRRVAHLETA